ncbi:hypothetical protein FGRMN_1252 [Fusarium graminum]|nr:hypothetical protein FGRMN_1252 [Fusarium graminum]
MRFSLQTAPHKLHHTSYVLTMAEPLSTAASIAGLVTLADLLFRSDTKYLRSYKGAQKEVEALVRGIRDLFVVLHNLSLLTFDLEQAESLTQSPGQKSLQPHHLHDCRQLLRRPETKVSRIETLLNSDSGRDRLQGCLKWPFTSTESKDMILEIQRYKQIPGGGKSVLAAATVEECLQRNAGNTSRTVAYFFCTYRSELSEKPSNILLSLCTQLALQDESAFEILQKYYDELYSDS